MSVNKEGVGRKPVTVGNSVLAAQSAIESPIAASNNGISSIGGDSGDSGDRTTVAGGVVTTAAAAKIPKIGTVRTPEKVRAAMLGSAGGNPTGLQSQVNIFAIWKARFKDNCLPGAEKNRVFLNFLNGLKTEETLDVYLRNLHVFMRENKVKSYEYFTKTPVEKLEQKLLDYVLQKKMTGRTGNCILNHIKPIKLLLEMNKVNNLDWKMVHRTVPPRNVRANDKAYNLVILRLMWQVADYRTRVALGLGSSSGMRPGGMVALNVGDLVTSPLLNKYGIFKIIVYRGTPLEYHTYCTIETRVTIEEYLAERARYGEEITAATPLFRNYYDRDVKERVKNPERVESDSIGKHFSRILQELGIRAPVKLDKAAGDVSGSVRHEIKILYGMRKFFETTATDWGLNESWIRLLQGHKSGLKGNYYRPEDEGYILTGNEAQRGYVDIIEHLTINNTELLARENMRLKAEATSVSKLEGRFKTVVDILINSGLDQNAKNELAKQFLATGIIEPAAQPAPASEGEASSSSSSSSSSSTA